MSVVVCDAPAGMEAEIRRAARRAMQAGGYHSGRLEIAIVGDAEMRRQHQRWLGRATVTDVLSFDLRDRAEPGRVEGQLIVCETVARRQAKLHDADWRGELLLYVVHGCLHLCGHDDRRAVHAAEMHAREDQLLSLLGWGPVFSAPAAGQVGRRRQASSRSRGRV
ncbi:MAG TPA: rRNA maturation RNase YbeY [Phycisphaerae bacterium]|nr:rRNA maturation RNase YbeY [Phycisphaerae bacterium]